MTFLLQRKMVFFLEMFLLASTFRIASSDPTDYVEDVAFIKIGDYSK